MESSKTLFFALISLLFSFISCCIVSAQTQEALIECLSRKFSLSETLRIVYLPNTTSYNNLLQSSIQNLRYSSSSTPKPLMIIAPKRETQVQAVVVCCKEQGLQLRVRSGGHDYEGLSYRSRSPFVVLDLSHFRSIDVDVDDKLAWVDSGATLGELYYNIAKTSGNLGFPAGLCPTVGVGGHISGGGIGTLMRKYGLAADNVIDARLVDAKGRILDRGTMGEDLFWALRGGGGGSFGVILSWKIKLVEVPPVVTVSAVHRTLQQNATNLVSRWQSIADKLHEDLFMRVLLQKVDGTIQVSFNSLFLGEANQLLPMIEKSLPELGLEAKDCKQMTWIQSVLEFAGYSSADPTDVLLKKDPPYGKSPFKGKSDFVMEPIPEKALEGFWKLFLEDNTVLFKIIILDPLGGKMNKISNSATPFPHRKGNLYNIQYMVKWGDDGKDDQQHLDFIERLYNYMTPYVSKSPRRAYINYRDLDLGSNGEGNYTSYFAARTWGLKYFKSNFKRLGQVKAAIDKDNFFRSEQSIPPMHASKKKRGG
ncbi:tetrahydroberberine oxidase-like [Aristolochia californica]|uniref:tetrahydroberberine oxidase-like n=1 Tax=Aristolochia californica TaxID=171875 RepID=UPI0035DF303A